MSATDDFKPLTGSTLVLAGFVLALSNFMVVLDTTIANVSVAHIAGSLGISSTQGTWIITSYAVAEAICVPLTGWLAARFGTVRVFTFGMIGFGVCSVLCGISTSLTMLVLSRIGQGLCGGPLMPLSQTLLLRIFPREKHGQAMAMWAMTTVTAPIFGPLLGGTISDTWSWHWIFFINIPVAVLCAYGATRLLKSAETRTERLAVDKVGLGLLIIWIAALQLILDLGREHDWFNDRMIVVLAIVAVIGFALFVVWELTERAPIVDLRIFRHRGFTVAIASLSLAFGMFFALAMLIPQWLQTSLGYTSTWSGYVTAFTGVGALLSAPVVSRLAERIDQRWLVFGGILWMGFAAYLQSGWTSGADYWSLAVPQMLLGAGLSFFMIPLTTIALATVNVEETASAAGIMNFLRTMSGAVAASICTTLYQDNSTLARGEMVARLNSGPTMESLGFAGFSMEQVRGLVERIVVQESNASSLNQIMLLTASVLIVAAVIIWLAPRPAREIEPGMAH